MKWQDISHDLFEMKLRLKNITEADRKHYEKGLAVARQKIKRNIPLFEEAWIAGMEFLEIERKRVDDKPETDAKDISDYSETLTHFWTLHEMFTACTAIKKKWEEKKDEP